MGLYGKPPLIHIKSPIEVRYGRKKPMIKNKTGKLPLDTSSFRRLREEGSFHIDKTRWLHRMIEEKIKVQCGRARSHILAGVNPAPEGWPATG